MVKSLLHNILSAAADASQSQGKRKSHWGTLIRVAVTIGIFAALFSWLPIEVLIEAIASIPLHIWVFVVGLVLVNHFVSAMKWRLLLSAAGTRILRTSAVQAHGAGLFATIFLPGNVGGDFVRAAVIARQKKGQMGAIAVGGMGDRVNDLVALVLISFVASLFLPEIENSAYGNVLSIVTAAILLGVIVGSWTILKFPLDRLPVQLSNVVTKLRDALRSLLAEPLAGAIGLFMSIVIQCIFVFLNIVFAKNMGLEVPIVLWFFAWPMTKLIALVPISLGGLGVRNAVLAGLMAPFGIASSLVVAQSLCWDAVMILTGLAGLGAAAVPSSNNVRPSGPSMSDVGND